MKKFILAILILLAAINVSAQSLYLQWDDNYNTYIVVDIDGNKMGYQSSVEEFSEGLAPVKINNKYGYIDKTGKIVIKPSFDYAWNFSEGLAMVRIDNKYGYIDKTGKIVIKPSFVFAWNFSEGLAPVKIDNKYGYIDKTGEFVIKPSFEVARPFSEGLAPVKYGYIDKTGNFVIKLNFDIAKNFSEGLAPVKIDNEYGYIDKTGEFVIKPSFEVARPFSEGLAPVKINNKWICIDKSGKYVKFNPANIFINSTLTGYIEQEIGSREEFFKNAGLVPLSEEDIVEQVRRKIEKWQSKDEFETTAEWQARVNEKTRQAKARHLADSISRAYADCSAALANEYNTKYESLAKEFCDKKGRYFAKQEFTLQPYDADNETYLINANGAGDILLPVPRSEARSFKDNWEVIRKSVKASFVPAGNEVALSKVTFGNYTYDTHTKAEYARVEIDYNFRPIDAGSLNYNFAALEDVAYANAPKATAPVAANATPQSAQPKTRRISAGNASDVDTDIPQTNLKNDNTFALIIANTNYAHASTVANAQNDGEVVARYFERTLGIPAQNINVLHDATYGQIASALNHLGDIAAAFGAGKFNVIFYYVGHGLPDETNHESFILPVDVDPKNTDICYSLNKVYSTLGSLQANTVTVMVDACFSGSNYGNGMLNAQSMGAVIKAKVAAPRGNMVVLSAAQADETAYPYAEQGHGLFTYWLLKKLKESKGNVTLGELAEYLTDNVRKTSVVVNRKAQTPAIAVSPTLGDNWRSRQFGK